MVRADSVGIWRQTQPNGLDSSCIFKTAWVSHGNGEALVFYCCTGICEGPVAGVYVDRWNRKKVMVISDIIRGVSVVTIPIFVQLGMMPVVYCLVFVNFFWQQGFFIPSKLAIIPALVSEDKLLIANSLSNTTRVIATILDLLWPGLLFS